MFITLINLFFYFSLSSRERTPIKNPQTSREILKSPPRKRLSLIDIQQSEFTTPEKKRKSYSLIPNANLSQKQTVNDLISGLRGLSHEQLVQMIMDLVYMQETGLLCKNTTLRNVLLKKMPVADIEQLLQKLRVLRHNCYASLICSNLDDSAFSRAYVHLDTFEVNKRCFLSFFFFYFSHERKSVFQTCRCGLFVVLNHSAC